MSFISKFTKVVCMFGCLIIFEFKCFETIDYITSHGNIDVLEDIVQIREALSIDDSENRGMIL